MNTRRSFLKKAGLGMAALQLKPTELLAVNRTPLLFDFWLWVRPQQTDTDIQLKQRDQSYREAGIRGPFFEDSSKRQFQLAKEHGLEAHRWVWTGDGGEKAQFEMQSGS